jgi:hypothetical protein
MMALQRVAAALGSAPAVLAGAGVALCATLALADPVPSGATRLIGNVGWTASGESGTAVFQGLATSSTLSGHLFAGESQLVVSGTIEPGGAVSGNVTASDGTPVGTFAGIREGETLRGTYDVGGGAAASQALSGASVGEAGEPTSSPTWEADATDVPVP